jgi:preprotein translocase subunit SecE
VDLIVDLGKAFLVVLAITGLMLGVLTLVDSIRKKLD